MNLYQQAIITNREREIIHLLAYEHTTKEIANKLFISLETVKSHRKNILQKLEVKNVAGIVRVAFQKNLIR